jgi:hypothetical protein
MNDELRMANRKANDDDKKYYLCLGIILKLHGGILQGKKFFPSLIFPGWH